MEDASRHARQPVDAQGLPIVGVLPELLSDPLRTMTRLAHQHLSLIHISKRHLGWGHSRHHHQHLSLIHIS